MANIYDLSWIELVNKFTDENFNVIEKAPKGYVGQGYLGSISKVGLRHMISTFGETVTKEEYKDVLRTIYKSTGKKRLVNLSESELRTAVSDLIKATVVGMNPDDTRTIKGYREGSKAFSGREGMQNIWNRELSGFRLNKDQRDQIEKILNELSRLGSTEYSDKFDYEAAFDYALNLVKKSDMTLDQKISDLDLYVKALSSQRQEEEISHGQSDYTKAEDILSAFQAYNNIEDMEF